MPADPEGVQAVLKWLLREKIDFKLALSPLVSRGFTSLESLAAMSDDDIKGVVRFYTPCAYNDNVVIPVRLCRTTLIYST